MNYPLGKQRPATGFDVTSGYAGTSSERDVVGSLAGPALGVPARQVPDVATLLFAPAGPRDEGERPMSARSAGFDAKHQALGVAFLVLLLLFVYVTYAIFTKKFVDYVPVKLKTSSIGLQLPAARGREDPRPAGGRGAHDRVRRRRRHAVPRHQPERRRTSSRRT